MKTVGFESPWPPLLIAPKTHEVAVKSARSKLHFYDGSQDRIDNDHAAQWLMYRSSANGLDTASMTIAELKYYATHGLNLAKLLPGSHPFGPPARIATSNASSTKNT